MPAAIEFSAAQIRALSDTSRSQASLAMEFGCSTMPIRNWRRKHGIVSTAPVGRPRASAALVEDPEAGPTELELARDEIKQLRTRAKRDDKQTLGEERVLRAIETACANVQPLPAVPLPTLKSASLRCGIPCRSRWPRK